MAPASLQDLPADTVLWLLCSPCGKALGVTCKQFAAMSASVKPLVVAGLALHSSPHPGRAVGDVIKEKLACIPCTPSAASFVGQWVDQSQVALLMNPQLAQWVAEYAGAQCDWRVCHWLLNLNDPVAALATFKRYPSLLQRVWVSAAGAAAGGQHTHLFAALCALPCAPSAHCRLSSSDKCQLLSTVIRHAKDPHGALQATVPLCELQPPKVVVFFAPPPTDESNVLQETLKVELREALLAAGLEACARGFTAALPALISLGLVMSAEVARQLLQTAVKADQAEFLAALLMTQISSAANPRGNVSVDAPQPLHEAYIADLRHAWNSAALGGKQGCLLAMINVAPHLVNLKEITRLLSRSYVGAALACIQHPNAGPRFTDCHGLVDVLSLDQCTLEVLHALLEHRPIVDHACLDAALQSVQAERIEALLSHLDNTAQNPLSDSSLASALLTAARVYKQRGSVASPAFHLIFERLVLKSGHPPLQHAYLGFQLNEPAEDAAPLVTTKVWTTVLHALLVKGDRLLVRLVLGMPCMSGLGMSFSPDLLQAAASLSATSAGHSPALLMELIKRGATATDVVQAVEHTESGVLLLANLLPTIRDHQAALTAAYEEAVSDWDALDSASAFMQCMGLDDLRLHMKGQCADDIVSWLAETATTSANPNVSKAAMSCLETILCDCLGNPEAALRLPASATQFRSKRDHHLLQWLLSRFGAERILGPSSAAAAGGCHTRAEVMAKWAPLPFIVTLLAAGASKQAVLSGLCLRSSPPPHAFVHQVIYGELPCLARAPPAAQAGSASSIGTAAATAAAGQPQVDLGAAEQVIRHAVMSGQYALASLLMEHGASQRHALQACKGKANPDFVRELLLNLQPLTMQDMDVVFEVMCRQEEAVSLLVSVGAHPNELLLCAAKAGCCQAIQLLIGVYGAESSWLDQPVISAAENGHIDAVMILIDQGASADAALYGAACGQQLAVAEVLLRTMGSDPHWEQGATLEAALAGGHEPLLNLLLDAPT